MSDDPEERRATRRVIFPALDVKAYVIACDESGATGERLLDSQQRIFVHASTDLSPEGAENVVQRIRREARIHADEIKWSKLSPRQRQAVIDTGIFDPRGPLAGRGAANVIDKMFMLVAKVIDLLAEEVQYETYGNRYLLSGAARNDALTLFHSGPRAFGEARWLELLGLFERVVRRSKRGGDGTVEEFYEMVDDLRLRGHRRDVERIMSLVWQARHRADELLEPSEILPTLNPLMTALPSTIRTWWGRVKEPIYVVHDQQTDFPDETIRVIQATMYAPHRDHRAIAPSIVLAGLETGNSKHDARIQVADLLAGAMRDAVTQVLDGHEPDVRVGHFLTPGTMWPH